MDFLYVNTTPSLLCMVACRFGPDFELHTRKSSSRGDDADGSSGEVVMRLAKVEAAVMTSIETISKVVQQSPTKKVLDCSQGRQSSGRNGNE